MLLTWTWDENPDADYRQQVTTTPKGTRVIVCSTDRDGDEWAYQVGGADMVFGLDSEGDAKREATDAAKEYDA